MPEPDARTFVPNGFAVQRVETLSLDGSRIQQRVIASAGPFDAKTRVRLADLQILQWDSGRWYVAFDLATQRGFGAILPTKLIDTVVQFFPAKLDVSQGNQLIFETQTYGNAYVYGVGIIDYHDGQFKLVDFREYPDLADLEPIGPALLQRLQITSSWTTYAHPRSDGPLRKYQIELRVLEGNIRVVADDRPFLGVQLSDRSAGASLSNVVKNIWPSSSANGVLQPGDTLIDIDGMPNPPQNNGPAIPDAIDRHKAGDEVTVHYARMGVQRQVQVTLDSLLSLQDEPYEKWLGKYF